VADARQHDVDGETECTYNKPQEGHGPTDRRGMRSHSPSFWSDAIWAGGSDGKVRRIEPCIPLLAHGVPGRVGKLRAYGNAIVAPLAAEVVKALMETLDV
jgi:DNA (cytosine-5)-methyltransferase 1